MGGLGNNLFQLDHLVKNNNGNTVVVVTNLVQSKFISKVLGWTFHSSVIDDLAYDSNLNFKRVSWGRLFFDLSGLFINQKLKTNLIQGISWESINLTRVNFGYFQYPRSRVELKVMIVQNQPKDFVMHLRLTDSPLKSKNIKNVISLLSNIYFEEVFVVTDNTLEAKKILKDFENIEYSNGTIIQDFMTLATCKRAFISNSTFSIYAILQNENIEEFYIDKMYAQKFFTNHKSMKILE